MGVQLYGRPGAGKSTLVDRLAASLSRLEAVGLVTPAARPPRLEEARGWCLREGARITAEGLLRLVERLPLGRLDFLFVEVECDTACTPPVDVGCHARTVVLPAPGGLGEIERAAAAIREADFVLLTQGDRVAAGAAVVAAARARVAAIAPVPAFVLSLFQHSDWMEWIAYLERLRSRHLRPRSEAVPADLFLG
ncbi:MAG: hypothetical protein D6739_12410 [Nitrospirae bacterium]|nr:MAG: hypothetical protein D6739_12410 [Nitrospirota bacterium]